MKATSLTREQEIRALESYFERLWPILRSITGEGVRQTHDILSELLDLERHEIPSGTQVFDWTIPQEWLVREAYVITPDGRRILDIRDNNLHLLNYSVPFKGSLSLAELDTHLYSMPEQPGAIPYVTSYYAPRWGFCLSHHERQALPQGDYQIIIDSEQFDGSLTLSEALLRGQTEEEILISTYTCHPSLANNELSGPLVAAFLYQRIRNWPARRYSYRFVFLPETIGALAYLSLYGEHFKQKLAAGYIVTCIGDDAPFTYKRSRQGASLADRAAEHVLKHSQMPYRVLPFSPMGSDERQYCSPGFNLPMGSLMRSMYGEYPEYHTSLDNRDFISFAALQGSVDMYEQILLTLEHNHTYYNQKPYGEPRLDKHGLYSSLGHTSVPDFSQKVLWLLNYSDSQHDLLDIAEKSGYSVLELQSVAQRCLEVGLLAPK